MRHTVVFRLLDLSIGATWNRERECCPRALVPDCPKPASMTLHNRSADGESDSHAITLRCIKGLEEFFLSLGGKSHSRIFDAEVDCTFVAFCLNQHLPWTIIDLVHCIRAIPHQIQDYLLNLSSISGHGWQINSEVPPQNDPISLQVVEGQRNYLLRCLVQVEQFECGVFPDE